MTALSLELTDITKDWVSYFVMLCQSLQLTSVVVCLWVFLLLVLSSASEMHTQSGWKSDDWLGHCRIFHCFAFKNSCVAFAVYFGSLSSCTMKRRPINFVAFGRIWAESISLYTRILPAASFLCHVITTFMHLADAFIQSDLQLHSGYTFLLVHVFPGNRTHNLSLSWCNVLPLSHTGTRWTPETHCYWKPYTLLQSHCSTIFHRWCCMLWAVPSLLHTFFLPIVLVHRLILISFVQRMYFQKWSDFF